MPSVLIVDSRLPVRVRLTEQLEGLDYRVHALGDTASALAQGYCERPDVWLIGAQEENALVHQIKADGFLAASYCIVLHEEPGSENRKWEPSEQTDWVLMEGCGIAELIERVRIGTSVAQAMRQAERTALPLAPFDETENEADDEMTLRLIEAAAEMQSEIWHQAEREGERIREAQSDTLTQTSVTLKHEINNPLFVILGGCDSALRRLDMLASQGADVAALRVSLERIHRGAERIQQVVSAMGEVHIPLTTDYVAGVSMLNLHETPTLRPH